MAVELCPLTQVLSGLPGYLISIEQQLIVPLAVHCCQRGGPARVLTLIRPTLITGGRNLDIETPTRPVSSDSVVSYINIRYLSDLNGKSVVL